MIYEIEVWELIASWVGAMFTGYFICWWRNQKDNKEMKKDE